MDTFQLLKRRLELDSTILPFDCGISDLNEFLIEDAKPHLAARLAVTYLFEANNITAAYYSVLNDSLDYSSFLKYDSDTIKAMKEKFGSIQGKFSSEKSYWQYPAVKIGRFAIHKDFQNAKLGRRIMDEIIESFTNKNKTGCAFVTVDALNIPDLEGRKAIGFYEKLGFVFLTKKDSRNHTRLMYLPL